MFCNGIEPTCACGCGENTKYLGIVEGFRKYQRGHISRIRNNWGHNKKALKNSINSRKQMFQDGELEIWNKGLTKKEHEALERQGRTFSENMTDEFKKRLSERMRKNRLDGTIPTQKGEKHSQWKGGSSEISARCHGNRRLYKEWKYPFLQKSGFKCERCGSTEKLEVHHNKETMAEIINNHTTIINPDKLDDFDLQTKIVEAVVNYHIKNNVSGEVICHECHKKEHPSYNYRY